VDRRSGSIDADSSGQYDRVKVFSMIVESRRRRGDPAPCCVLGGLDKREMAG